jgi:hypothetical protein
VDARLITMLCAAIVFPSVHAAQQSNDVRLFRYSDQATTGESESSRNVTMAGMLPRAVSGKTVSISGSDNARLANTGHRTTTTASAALAAAVRQNTPGNSQGQPAGVPRTWSWYNGKNGATSAALSPAGFSAMTGWGIVYPIDGQPTTNSHVVIRDFVSYVRLTSGQWVKVQDQATDPLDGVHFPADFSGYPSQFPFSESQILADGSWEIDSPPSGQNDHFWPRNRGLFTTGTVDGVFIAADIRTDNQNANLIAALGADYWLDATATTSTSTNSATNHGIGQSDFIKLTTQWQTLYYYSLSTQQLESNLPPPLASVTPATTAPR